MVEVDSIQMSSLATLGNVAIEATGLNVDSDRAPSRAKFANSSGSERTSGERADDGREEEMKCTHSRHLL